MKKGQFDRSVTLLCPTCGGSQFEMDDDADEPTAPVRCVSCDRQFTKSELVQDKEENIDHHVSEIGEEALSEAAKDLRRRLQKDFKGNKFIKFK